MTPATRLAVFAVIWLAAFGALFGVGKLYFDDPEWHPFDFSPGFLNRPGPRGPGGAPLLAEVAALFDQLAIKDGPTEGRPGPDRWNGA